jgi:large subunit ribosomal protein L6
MSRIAKRPIAIPDKTEVSVSEGRVTVKGPKGELSKELHPFVSVAVEAEGVTVTPSNETKLARALWGTFGSHVRNMLQGVNEPYAKKLILEGVGYRMAVTGKDLTLNVGYSHPVVMPIPEGVEAVVEKNELTLTSIDKEKLGQFAAEVRAKRKPEPYKGKGFRYSDETILRKQGKKAV